MHAIDTSNLTKRYAETVAIDALDLRVRTGEVFGFVGPNGAGKSTTIAICLGLRTPTDGDVLLLDRSPFTDQVALRRRVGSLPERGGLLDRVSGVSHLDFLVRAQSAAGSPTDLLDRVGLDPSDGKRPVRTYSSGMAQRLRLALTLVGDPELLILDEPASGLDPEGIERLREIVRAERARGATVFFSSHQLGDVAAVCDRIGFLVDGRLREVVDGGASRADLAERFDELVRRER